MIYVGIDVGGTTIKAGLLTEDGRVLDKDSIPTAQGSCWQDQVRATATCVLALMERNGISADQVENVGVGVPGVVDTRTGNIAFCTNLGWKDVDFSGVFRQVLDKPVFIDNDATVAALAESVAGVTKNTDSSVFLTLGTGVGGGIVLHGRVWSGFHGIGSEIGHMILKMGGIPCTCGNRGCVERYCSATAIIRMGREAMEAHPESALWEACGRDPEALNARMVFDASRAGDPAARAVFDEYIACLAQLIASVIQFLDPEVVVLGGGVSKAGAYLLDAVQAEVGHYLLYKDLPYSRIELASLSADAGIIGAAMLGRK